jgi:hypothetical protein
LHRFRDCSILPGLKPWEDEIMEKVTANSNQVYESPFIEEPTNVSQLIPPRDESVYTTSSISSSETSSSGLYSLFSSAVSWGVSKVYGLFASPREATFSDIPVEYQTAIFSILTTPPRINQKCPIHSCFDASDRTLASVRKMNGEDYNILFNQLTRRSLATLSKIALVCKEWQEVQQSDLLWKPLFIRCLRGQVCDMTFSSEETYMGKVRLWIKSLEEHRSVFLKIGFSQSHHLEILTFRMEPVSGSKISDHSIHPDDSGVNCVTARQVEGSPKDPLDFIGLGTFAKAFEDCTHFFIHLLNHDEISQAKKIELTTKLILLRPKFDASQVACILYQLRQTSMDYDICFDLMIKLNYDLSAFFEAACYPRDDRGVITFRSQAFLFFAQHALCSQVEGITLGDYVKCGLQFNLIEHVAKASLLLGVAGLLLQWYNEEKKFECTVPIFEGCKHIPSVHAHMRKVSPTEEEVKNLIFDLLTKADLDLNLFCQADWFQPPIPGMADGPALSLFRTIANSDFLPQPNAFSQALKEFDPI